MKSICCPEDDLLPITAMVSLVVSSQLTNWLQWHSQSHHKLVTLPVVDKLPLWYPMCLCCIFRAVNRWTLRIHPLELTVR